jgi:hypothetical protein
VRLAGCVEGMTRNFPESGPTQDVRIFPDLLYDEVVDLPYVASVGLVEAQWCHID